MEYILSSVFGQTALKHGPFIALAVLVAFALIALLVYYAKSRIDARRQRDAADSAARAAAEAADRAERTKEAEERAREAAGRDRERQALLAELGSTRQQIHSFLTNHLEHLRVEREAHEKILSEISVTMREQSMTNRAVAEDLRAHRAEEGARTESILKKLEHIHLSVVSKAGKGLGDISA